MGGWVGGGGGWGGGGGDVCFVFVVCAVCAGNCKLLMDSRVLCAFARGRILPLARFHAGQGPIVSATETLQFVGRSFFQTSWSTLFGQRNLENQTSTCYDLDQTI